MTIFHERPAEGLSFGAVLEVPEQVEREAGEAGQLACIDCFDPGRDPGAEAAGEHFAECADVSGDRVQFWAACQDILQAGAAAPLSTVGCRVSRPVSCRTAGGRGGAPAGAPRRVAM
ncbi:hypothetical protein ACFCYH_16835 [Streptomyces sp. NPDC056400]|uniref:hypothetical protein n=1 Tax=Streptomyces sp. NPDC056400 TaxID=3345808 RepID=UPI0035E10288